MSAADIRGHLASYSNFGNVSIVAPGGDFDKDGAPIAVWGIGGTETRGWVGTTQAAPHVVGAIALAMAKHEEFRRHPDLVATAIRDTAVPMQPMHVHIHADRGNSMHSGSSNMSPRRRSRLSPPRCRRRRRPREKPRKSARRACLMTSPVAG